MIQNWKWMVREVIIKENNYLSIILLRNNDVGVGEKCEGRRLMCNGIQMSLTTTSPFSNSYKAHRPIKAAMLTLLPNLN